MRWTYAHPAGEVLVEQARVEDASALVKLHRDVLSERDWFITLPAEFVGGLDQKIRLVRDFSRSSNSVFLVARSQGQLVGMLTVQGGVLARMRHTGKLEIMVAADARGRGVGKALMTACVDWSQKNAHIEKLGLSVFATNERAIAMYRAFGFAEEGRRTREYKLEDGTYRDDLLMYRFV